MYLIAFVALLMWIVFTLRWQKIAMIYIDKRFSENEEINEDLPKPVEKDSK